MEIISAIGNWIAESESLLSGAAALIVLLGVLTSVMSIAWRRLRQPPQPEVEEAAPEEPVITLKQLSAPSPHAIQFAKSDGLRIAYSVMGEGSTDVVMAPGIISNLNMGSHMPPIRDTADAISSFSRVVCFDKRGQGLSDPSLKPPNLEQRVHDIEAVMDAAGMQRPVLYGISEGGPMCMKFAHDHPERVKGLVLLGTTACWVQSEDFPIGLPERALEGMSSAWGSGSLRDVFFPGISREVMDDKTYQGFEKLIASRDSIRQLVEYMKETDVRHLLPNIRCPVLVIHFGGDLSVPIRMGRAVAEALPNAEFLEVSGTDHADLSQSAEGMRRLEEFVLAL